MRIANIKLKKRKITTKEETQGGQKRGEEGPEQPGTVREKKKNMRKERYKGFLTLTLPQQCEHQ